MLEQPKKPDFRELELSWFDDFQHNLSANLAAIYVNARKGVEGDDAEVENYAWANEVAEDVKKLVNEYNTNPNNKNYQYMQMLFNKTSFQFDVYKNKDGRHFGYFKITDPDTFLAYMKTMPVYEGGINTHATLNLIAHQWCTAIEQGGFELKEYDDNTINFFSNLEKIIAEFKRIGMEDFAAPAVTRLEELLNMSREGTLVEYVDSLQKED